MISNFPVWALVLIIIGCLLAGLVAGFFITRTVITKQIKENPPITRDGIKALYKSMGRTPSEAQINAAMRAFETANNKAQKKK